MSIFGDFAIDITSVSSGGLTASPINGRSPGLVVTGGDSSRVVVSSNPAPGTRC